MDDDTDSAEVADTAAAAVADDGAHFVGGDDRVEEHSSRVSVKGGHLQLFVVIAAACRSNLQ